MTDTPLTYPGSAASSIFRGKLSHSCCWPGHQRRNKKQTIDGQFHPSYDATLLQHTAWHLEVEAPDIAMVHPSMWWTFFGHMESLWLVLRAHAICIFIPGSSGTNGVGWSPFGWSWTTNRSMEVLRNPLNCLWAHIYIIHTKIYMINYPFDRLKYYDF